MKKNAIKLLATIAIICSLSTVLYACSPKKNALKTVCNAFAASADATKVEQTSTLTTAGGEVLYGKTSVLTKTETGYDMDVTEKTINADSTGDMYDEKVSHNSYTAEEAKGYMPILFELSKEMFENGKFDYEENDGKYVLTFALVADSVKDFFKLTDEEAASVSNARVELIIKDGRAYSYEATYDTSSSNKMSISAKFTF